MFQEYKEFCKTITRMLYQFSALLHRRNQAFYAYRVGADFFVVSGSGVFSDSTGRKVYDVLSSSFAAEMELAIRSKVNLYYKDHVFVYFKSDKGSESVLFVEIEVEPVHIYAFEVLVDCFRFYIGNWELTREIESTQREFIYMLGEAAELRSFDTGEHVKRVAEYSKLLAGRCGLPKTEVELIYWAAPLHDVGKLGVAEAILNKPGRLMPEEFTVVKEHCQIGFKMLSRLDQPLMRLAAQIAYEHHERFDGSGYPRGLKGEDISLCGRIVSIADVFDALGTERVYKKAWPREDILQYLVSEKGRHFDPGLVDLFLECDI